MDEKNKLIFKKMKEIYISREVESEISFNMFDDKRHLLDIFCKISR